MTSGVPLNFLTSSGAAEAGSNAPHLGEQLITLGVLFVIAYVLGRLGKRIGLPAIPIYMVVGLLASPSTHIFPLSLPTDSLSLVAVFGLILLLFNLGLEFDQEEFFAGAGRLLLSGGSYIVLNMGLGWLFGALVGWGPKEALLIAGMVGTSSSAIITKLLFELKRLANDETPAILGATVVGDLFIAVYLVIVSVVLSGHTDLWSIVLQIAIAAAFLVAMFLAARWGTRVVDFIFKTGDNELFIVLLFGVAVLFAGLGELTGVTDAIGAFLIGLALGASRHAGKIERISEPLRDLFAAFFFLDFGVGLDVTQFPGVIPEVAIAVVGTLIVNWVAGEIIARLNGLGRKHAINIAVILMSRGEFTLILATLAIAAGLEPRLSAFAGLYVLVMAIVGPLIAANSEKISAMIFDRRRAPAARPTPASQLADEPMESDGKYDGTA